MKAKTLKDGIVYVGPRHMRFRTNSKNPVPTTFQLIFAPVPAQQRTHSPRASPAPSPKVHRPQCSSQILTRCESNSRAPLNQSNLISLSVQRLRTKTTHKKRSTHLHPQLYSATLFRSAIGRFLATQDDPSFHVLRHWKQPSNVTMDHKI